jgi:nucleoside-diphosphate-sugar epimerase
MKFFVTGATGFIGGHLCRRLLAEGHEVSALVRSPDKARGLTAAGAVMVRGDLSVFRDPGFAIPECDVVIHLAGIIAAEKLSDYDRINFQGVRDLVECLQRQPWKLRRLVFASSLAAAGPSPYDSALTETDPPAPIDPYGRAKLAAEKILAEAPFPTTAFRPALVFGPHDPATLTIYKSARNGVGMAAWGRPQQLSFVDVADLVEAILLMSQDPAPGHKVYFVSHPNVMDIRKLWRSMGEVFGKKVLVVALPRPVLYVAMLVSTLGAAIFKYTNQLDKKQYRQIAAPAFVCSSATLRQDLGWTPTRDLDESIRVAVAGYREAGELPRT